MQEAFFVASEVADGLYGPYSRPVADRVLKIVRMASDETAELEVAEVDVFGEQLQSGLLPFKVCVIVLQGKVQSVEVSLCWPPVPGGILGEEPERGEDKAGRTAEKSRPNAIFCLNIHPNTLWNNLSTITRYLFFRHL